MNEWNYGGGSNSPRFDFAGAWNKWKEDSFIGAKDRLEIDKAYEEMELLDFEMSK
jgi:hypothetical protein